MDISVPTYPKPQKSHQNFICESKQIYKRGYDQGANVLSQHKKNYKLVCYLLLFPIQIIWYPVLTKVLSRIFMTANTAPYNLYRIKLFWKAHNLDCFWSLWTVSLPKIVWSGNLPLSNCQTSCCVIKDNKYRYIALDLSLFCLLGVFLYHVEKHQEKQGKDKSSMPTP